MNYLGNAFSFNMLIDDFATVSICPIQREEIPSDCVSIIGHQDLADYLGVPMNRISTMINKGDTLYVAQYTAPRLPEGTTKVEINDSCIRYLRVDVEYPAIEYLAEQILEYPEDHTNY